MSFHHPIIYLRNSALAGLAGILTGTVIHSVKSYPENGKKTLVVSFLSGCVGLGLGYTFAAAKNKNVYIYSLATGLNFLIVPLVFFSVRQMAKTGDMFGVFMQREKAIQYTLEDPYALSACSGTTTGFLISLYSFKRSMRSTALSAVVGGLLGLSGQLTYNIFNKWRINRAMKIHYPELFPAKKEQTWDEWLGDLLMRKRKLGRLDDEILELETELQLLETEEKELLKLKEK